jgi:4-amino-4-deoxy-L-arabinose transferase-like glycosyltransferase
MEWDRSGMTERRPRLLWIVLVGLALRLLVGSVILPDRMDPRRDHWEFDYEIGTIAASIATGHGFSNPYPYFGSSGPSAIIPPVYPYLLAGIFKVFGTFSKASAVVAMFINCLFAALTAVPVYWIARKCFSPRVGWWTGWIWAFFPYSVYWAAIFPWVTTLTTLLLATLVLYAIDLESTTRVRPWFFFGLLSGFAVLTDPVMLLVLPFVGGWPCYRNAVQRRPWLLPAAISALAVVIAPAPWLVRNYHVFHRPVFVRDTFWMNFRFTNVGQTIHWEDDSAAPALNPAELNEMARLGEIGYAEETKQQSLAFLREHPGLFARRVLRRIVYIWTGYWSFRRDYLQMEPYDPANIPFSTGLTILMLFGLRKMFRERLLERWLVSMILLIFPAIYYFTDPLQRHRGPIEPFIIMLSVYALSPRSALEEPRPRKDLIPAASA